LPRATKVILSEAPGPEHELARVNEHINTASSCGWHQTCPRVPRKDRPLMHKIFVSDYDGTITSKDSYSLVAERHAPADASDYFARYRKGRITHFEAMAAYFGLVPTEEQQIEELLDASQADPGFAGSVAHLQRAGWELLIVS